MFRFLTAKPPRRTARQAMKRASNLLASVARPAAGRPAPVRKEPEHKGPAKAPGRFVEVDSVRVHYIARGRGRPVVLLHGNGTMAVDYDICGLIDRLAERYRVIALDRPGFGHSTRPRYRTWTAQAQAQLVHRVLTQLGVERPLVVGHSWGTLVALALAQGGCDLRGLVLLSGYYYPSRRADVALSRVLANPWLGDAARAMMPKALTPALAAQAYRHVFQPQAVPARFTRRFPVEIAMGDTQLRASTEDAAILNTAVQALSRDYSKLDLPVAILAGDADAIVDLDEQSRRLHADLPGSTLRVLPGLGHMVHHHAGAAIGQAVDRMMAPDRADRR